MPRHINHVVDAPADPVVALVVAAGAVAGEVVALVHVQVGVHVALVRLPNGACHARPRLLERQHALDVVAVHLLARHRVNDGRLDAEEGQRG